MAELPKITLVLGGAASGKSALAERLACTTGRPRVYIATAEALDADMAARIAAHRRARGPGWRTIEAPRDLPAALSDLPADAVALIDCLTLWLTNHLIDGSEPPVAALCRALEAAPCPVILVSNEVGAGIVPADSLSRRFRDAQGRLNQRIAAQAGLVVAVMAGLPLALKGRLPDGAA